MIGKCKKILITTFLLAVCTYSFWGYIKELTGVSVFYYGTCLSFVGYTLVIKLLLIELSKNNKGLTYLIILSSIINNATINSLVDEALYDPSKLGINEYIGFVFCVIIAIYENRKRLKNDRANKQRPT